MRSAINRYLDRLAALKSQDLIFLSGMAGAVEREGLRLPSCLTREAGGLLFDLAVLLGKSVSEYMAYPREVDEIIRIAELSLKEPEGAGSEAELEEVAA